MITPEDIQTLERLYSPVGKVLLRHLKDHEVLYVTNESERLAPLQQITKNQERQIADLVAKNKNLSDQLPTISAVELEGSRVINSEMKRQVADLTTRYEKLCFQLVNANVLNLEMKRQVVKLATENNNLRNQLLTANALSLKLNEELTLFKRHYNQ